MHELHEVNRVVIGIGSNIEPREHVEAAIREMRAAHRLLGTSSFTVTKAIGSAGEAQQDDYLNGACLIETRMTREELRDWLRKMETRLGRARGPDKFAPRTIDLDIVVWNGEVVDPDLYERDFLRAAVRELCPEVIPTRPAP